MVRIKRFSLGALAFSIGLGLFTFVSCKQSPAEQEETTEPKTIPTRGVYGHPGPLWDAGHTLPGLGVNAVFVHSGSIDSAMVRRAREEGVKVYSEFATLNGKGYVEEHPEAWAVNEQGERVEAASWFMGVCPTEPGFRAYRFNQLRELLTRYALDGVWMDYVHWHAQFEEPAPILPETCFNDSCLERFAADTGFDIPEGTTAEKAQWILTNQEQAWRDWRCRIIHEWAVAMRKIVKEIRPDALLGLYHCPWEDEAFDGARRRILGLDYDLLKEPIDVFSPMVYHERMGKDPGWVAENIGWHCDRLGISGGDYPKVWPIVQAYNGDAGVSAAAFETVLRGGLADCADGVMMFTTRAVAEKEAKIAVVKRVYGK